MNPFRSQILGILILWLLCVSPTDAQLDSKRKFSREPGVIYVEDVTDKSIPINLHRPLPAYYQKGMKRYLGTLQKNQRLELVAFSENAYRVKGQAQQGGIAGWVPAKALSVLDPKLLENLKALYARAQKVDVLIKNKQVALGMTTGEVVRSLGKPDQQQSTQNREGRSEILDYVQYDKMPRYENYFDPVTDAIQQRIVYIKVETGRLSLVFSNDVLSAIQKTKGKPQGISGKIVPAPIELF